ncbi:CBS domain-containing protein [bacterium]|jgi:CBS domain-containing protein|nr:CBS domain-containing protein [bacterium]MDC3376426.1 CBS domain-containing protein [Candidatus Nanopelagicales bacterium]
MHVTTILSNKGHQIYSISPEATVAELVRTLCDQRVGALLVLDQTGSIVGIVSERDVVRALGENPRALSDSVGAIMTSDVVTAPDQAEVAELMRVMTERRIRHIPVLDDSGKLSGLVSIGDVVKNRMDELEAERSALMDYITQGG